MIVNVQGNNYIIADDDGKGRSKINKKKTDKTVKKLRENFDEIKNMIKKLYDEDIELYYLINTQIENLLDTNDGISWKLNDAIEGLEWLTGKLDCRDEIPSAEDTYTLEDLGYKPEIYGKSNNLYRKIIDDDGTTETIEEIVNADGTIIRRLVTIEWETTDFGKSSKKIVYKKLRIGKKLMEAAYNSFEIGDNE